MTRLTLFESAWSAWALAAVILMGLELLTLSFYLMVAGLCAAIVATLCYLSPGSMTLYWQALLFIVLVTPTSLLLTYRHRNKAPPLTSDTTFTGRIGTAASDLSPDTRGTVVFPRELFGAHEWSATAPVHVEQGQTVEVIAINGNTLTVQPAHSPLTDTF